MTRGVPQGPKRPLRIGYGRIFHEACAYSPIVTELDDFKRMHHLSGPALAKAASWRGSELKGYMAHAELTGFAAAARLTKQVEAVPLASSLAIPSGPLSAACFETLVRDLEERIRGAGHLDGLYLALHGSMQVQGLSEAPEAVILRRAKQAVGPQVKLAVSYDLHANLTHDLVAPVEVLIAYRSNPHWDLFPTGYRAGRRLIKCLRGALTPVHAWRKLPMVLGGGMTLSFLNPMRPVFRFMKALERQRRVISASLFMAHPYSPAEDLGWGVHVSTDGDAALANTLADQLADKLWSQRLETLPPLESMDDVLDHIATKRRRWRPVSVVDVDDIVGAGAPGGNTHVIRSLLARQRGLLSYVPLHDPEAVNALWESPLNAPQSIILRGTPGYGQPAVPLNGRVMARHRNEFGRILRFDSDGLRIALSERPPLPIRPKFWRQLGLRARRADVLIQKNFFHYRMFYAATSFKHIGAITTPSDPSQLGATSLARVRTRRYARPTYPQDQLDDWRMTGPG